MRKLSFLYVIYGNMDQEVEIVRPLKGPTVFIEQEALDPTVLRHEKVVIPLFYAEKSLDPIM